MHIQMAWKRRAVWQPGTRSRALRRGSRGCLPEVLNLFQPFLSLPLSCSETGRCGLTGFGRVHSVGHTNTLGLGGPPCFPMRGKEAGLWLREPQLRESRETPVGADCNAGRAVKLAKHWAFRHTWSWKGVPQELQPRSRGSALVGGDTLLRDLVFAQNSGYSEEKRS